MNRIVCADQETDETELLRFSRLESVERNTQIRQADNGTIFYIDGEKVHVKSEGKEISVELPCITHGKVCFGNALYLEKGDQAYKCVFEPPDTINVSIVSVPEWVHKSHWHCRVTQRDGDMYAYRTWSDSELDSVLVDCDSEKLKGANLMDVVGNRVIYSKNNLSLESPVLYELSEHAILIEYNHRHHVEIFHRPSSPYFYFFDDRLYTVDIESMEMLAPLKFETRHTIKSIHNGVIITNIHDEGEWYLSATLLPDGYFEPTLPMSAEWQIMVERINEMQQQLPIPEGLKSEFLDRFTPIKVLGRGGYGCVFEAEFMLLKRRYAVKRIPIRTRSGHTKDDALKEVLALDSFNHPGIVKYNHSWIEEPDKIWHVKQEARLHNALNLSEFFQYELNCAFLYIEMELCKSTLSTWLSDNANKDRDLDQMKSWFNQLLSAVAYIHKQGLIHRDLKPSNILFGSEEQLKICDLGISTSRKIIDDQEVPMSRTFDRGTLKYMAPEQQGWAGYSAKVDIFSLGLILAELWVPMSDDLAATVFNNYRSGRPNTILRHYPEVEHLVNWMTSVDDCERPDCEGIANHKFI